MKPTPLTPRTVQLLLLCALALTVPFGLSPSAFAQGRSGDRESAPRGTGGAATTRAGGGERTTATTGSARTGGETTAKPNSGRTRDGHEAEGTAVPRTTARPKGTSGVGGGYAGFYPIGSGLGYGGYYGGYVDPGDAGPDPNVPPPPASHAPDGAIKLKITPKQALVYVDGYFAGVVDEFDGLFQKLRIESGPHHIEVQAEGYEPLAFDVQITPDHTITYRADLRRIQ